MAAASVPCSITPDTDTSSTTVATAEERRVRLMVERSLRSDRRTNEAAALDAYRDVFTKGNVAGYTFVTLR